MTRAVAVAIAIVLTGCMDAGDQNRRDRVATERAVSTVLELADADPDAFSTRAVECFGALGGGTDREASLTAADVGGVDADRSDEILDAVIDGFEPTSPITDAEVTKTGEAPAREVGFFADVEGVRVSLLARITVDGQLRVRAETIC